MQQKESSPRESKLSREFEECIAYLNQFLPEKDRMRYVSWDMSAAKKSRKRDGDNVVMEFLDQVGQEQLGLTGFFHSGPEPARNATPLTLTPTGRSGHRTTPMLQRGVLRTNCIDCIECVHLFSSRPILGFHANLFLQRVQPDQQRAGHHRQDCARTPTVCARHHPHARDSARQRRQQPLVGHDEGPR